MVRSIVEALAEYAKVQPDKLFLADGKVELTYLDAWKCVYGYAVHLRELGIRRGDHVVVRNSQNAQLVISQLAIQLVGAVFVPIEKNAADDRIAEIIGAVEAKLYLAAKQGEFSCKWETIKDVLSYKMDDAAEMRISESDDAPRSQYRPDAPQDRSSDKGYLWKSRRLHSCLQKTEGSHFQRNRGTSPDFPCCLDLPL